MTVRSEEPEETFTFGWQPTAAQAQAVDLIAAGMDDAAVGRAVGVRRETVNRWRHEHEWMKAAVSARRRQVWEATVDRLRHVAAAAVDVLAARLDAAREAVGRGEVPSDEDAKAAAGVLRMLGAGEWIQREREDSFTPYGNSDASRAVSIQAVDAAREELGMDDADELDAAAEAQVWDLAEAKYRELCLATAAQDAADAREAGEGQASE